MTMPSPFTNILVVVDGSESAFKAADYAIRLAGFAAARLTAISIVDTDTLRKLMSARILVEEEVREFETELERSQRRHLDSVGHLARRAGVPLETALRTGVLHSAVLHEQKELGVDLIVIGGFHYSFTKLDLLARERQLIIDGAPCTVVVVK